MNSELIQAAVARAKAKMLEQKTEADRKAGKHLQLDIVGKLAGVPPLSTFPRLGLTTPAGAAISASPLQAIPLDAHPAIPNLYTIQAEEPVIKLASAHSIRWNAKQLMAIQYGMERKSFCLIGPAGSGKTTNLKGLLKELMDSNRCPPLDEGTKHLTMGAPGIALVSYTRRAVRNVAKQMPDDLKPHCLTIHKLIEFAPEPFEKETFDEKGVFTGMRTSMRFAPQRTRFNPLPRNLTTIVLDEASMISIELFELLLEALPNPRNVQFIVLGDLNQLPPVYGQAILGKMLLERPIIELTEIYRQALESPIIALALAVKDERFKGFNEDCANGTFKVTGLPPGEVFDARKVVKNKITIERAGRGKVTLHPWKTKWEQDDALTAMKGQINAWITSKEYNPDEDLILCPWNKAFGTDELNKSIANKLGKLRNADVYEIIAGYNKYYFAVGDKLMIDKQEAIIMKIDRNPKYLGKKPGPHSPYLDRWGSYGKAVVDEEDVDLSNEDIDALLETMSVMEERTAEASHVLLVKLLDTDEEYAISKSATINDSSFGYAISVHKAQGSECRKVFFITHYCHSAMLMRELVYTAITRAAEELYIVMSPEMLNTAAKRPRIKGNTLEAKLAWYQNKLDERLPS
jgi:ATP-dependent exoDNAse (exonuclease V) alpha subunit